jgi:hypothetical protein
LRSVSRIELLSPRSCRDSSSTRSTSRGNAEGLPRFSHTALMDARI